MILEQGVDIRFKPCVLGGLLLVEVDAKIEVVVDAVVLSTKIVKIHVLLLKVRPVQARHEVHLPRAPPQRVGGQLRQPHSKARKTLPWPLLHMQ